MLENFFKKHITRRNFLKAGAMGFVFLAMENFLLKAAFAKNGDSTGRKGKGIKGDHDLVIAEGDDPYANTLKAIEAMGGMERFVKKGDTVVIKPNMAWDRNVEQAANTNPAVVACLVELCYKAGAKRVNVFDNPCNEAERTYANSGIAKAAKEKGAHVYFLDDWNVVKAKFSHKSPMEGWPIYKDVMDCEVLINVPVLKHHGYTGLSLSIKNLMGACAGMRGMMHVDIANKLADVLEFTKPDLTVMDATRVLLRNGPIGGNLSDVAKMDTIICATDSVLADSFACSLVKRDPMSIGYIKTAASRNLGSTDLKSAKIKALRVHKA